MSELSYNCTCILLLSVNDIIISYCSSVQSCLL